MAAAFKTNNEGVLGLSSRFTAVTTGLDVFTVVSVDRRCVLAPGFGFHRFPVITELPDSPYRPRASLDHRAVHDAG